MAARTRSRDALAELSDALMAIAERGGSRALETFLASLPPDDLAVAEDVLGRQFAVGWRADPGIMANHLTGGAIKLWPYVRLLSRKFADAVEGRSKRQIWNVPARYGKSTIASRWGPAWCLDRYPQAGIILTSYGDALARENAVSVRDILTEHADVLRVDLRRDRRRQDRFVTSAGGGILAAGIGSGITGFGAGRGGGVIVDDPFKNWQDAHSQHQRDLVWNQYQSVLRLRLDDDDAWIIVVHTRWHEDDLTGRLVRSTENATGEDWELVRLPAIAEAADPRSPDPTLRLPDPLGREPGEVLEPDRFDLDAVRARALSLGSYLAAGLEQQRPSPEEGGEILRAWWKWSSTFPPRCDSWCTSWDMKLKDKETGDYVVGQAWGRTGADLWLFEQLRGQWNQPTTKLAIALMAVRHPQIDRHYIENTGNGPEVMAELRAGNADYVIDDEAASKLGMTEDERAKVQRVMRAGLQGLIPVTPKGPKPVRLRAVSGIIEAGNVWLRENDPAALALVNEAAAFPNGDHDDQVDAMSQALSKMRRGEATMSRSSRETPTPRAGARPTPAKPPPAAPGQPGRSGRATIGRARRR